MPIAATIAAPSGASSTAWYIRHIMVDLSRISIDVMIEGYLSGQNYTSGNASLDERSYTITGDQVASILTSGSVVLSVENWIIANDPAFASGTAS